MKALLFFLVISGLVFAQTPLAVSSTAIVDGYVGSTYGSVPQAGNASYGITAQPRYTASGGRAPYTFRIASGALPNGLTLGPGGFVLGVPANSGNSSFEVEVTDSNNQRARLANQRIAVQNPILISGFSWSVGTSVRFRPQCNGSNPFTYSISATPPGVSLNATSGQFSGAPTSAGSFPGRWVCASSNLTFTHDYVFTVGPMRQVSLNPTMVGLNYVFNPANQLGEGAAPFEYSVSGQLPPGVAMGSSSTGLIAGRPTAAGLYRFVVRRKDASEEIRSLEFFLSVSAAANFQLSSALLKFEVSKGNASPVTKAFLVKGSPTGSRFQTKVGDATAKWLSVSASESSLPGSATVSVNAAELEPGTYESRIEVSSVAGATPALSPAEIAVQVIVRNDVPPRLVADVESLQLSGRVGSTAAVLGKFLLKNAGGGIARFRVSPVSANKLDSLKWISIHPQEGDLKAGESMEVGISLSAVNLTGKTYSANLAIENKSASTGLGGLALANASQDESLDVPLHFVVRPPESPCPSVRLSPPGHWFESFPGGKAQTKESSLSLSGGLPENREYSIGQFAEDKRFVEITKGNFLGGNTIGFRIDPSKWTEQDSGFIYDIYGFFGGKCFSGLMTGAALILRENAFPTVSTRLVVLPARYYDERGLPGSFSIVPQSPGEFTFQIETTRNPFSDEGEFMTLNATSGIVKGSEEGQSTPVQINIIQVPQVRLKIGFYSYQLKITFTRKDGAQWWQFVDVMQLVSVPPLPLPVTPQLPPPPGTLPLYSRGELGARRTAAQPPKKAESCGYPGPQILSYVQPNFKAAVGRAFPLQALVLDTCGQLTREGSIRATSSNDDLNLELAPNEEGVWTANWIPREPAEALDLSFEYKVGDIKKRVSYQGEVSSIEGAPVLENRAFLNGFSNRYEGRSSPGALLVIRGRNLAAAGLAVAEEGSEKLGETSVSVNGGLAKLVRATPEELLLQMPQGIDAGTDASITVRRNGRVSAPEWLLVDTANPALSIRSSEKPNEADIQLIGEDGRTPVDVQRPALAGAKLVILATGLGAIDEEGRVKGQVKVYLGEGDLEAEVLEASAVAKRPGLYEVVFRLPEGIAATATLPVAIAVGDLRSTALNFAVQ